ncbi:MAG: stage 0 sporulation protein [Patescibacteria group bacterium]|nr:stage 0 sporulation protein [Patescibacteria group bacterium]
MTKGCQNCDKQKGNCPKKQHQFSQETELAKKLIVKYNLPMKLLEVEKGSEENQYTFHFSSETRIDFRDLVKDLQNKLNSKVILHQVGPRDEAKVVGGYGPCGYEVCCKAWLKDFESITTDMAKAQNLSSNLAKYTGMCGKLMCCLAYEIDQKDKPKKKADEVKALEKPENVVEALTVTEEKRIEEVRSEETKTAEKPAEEVTETSHKEEKVHAKPVRILRQLPKKKKR